MVLFLLFIKNIFKETKNYDYCRLPRYWKNIFDC